MMGSTQMNASKIKIAAKIVLTVALFAFATWYSGYIFAFTLMGVMDSNRQFYFYAGIWIAVYLLFLSHQFVAPFHKKWIGSLSLALISLGIMRWL
jgi:hypothetical protein